MRNHCVVFLSKTLYPQLSTDLTQEVMKLSTVVDWDVKHQKQTMQPIIERDIWLLLTFSGLFLNEDFEADFP